MLNFSDAEAPSDEKASDHFEMRVRPSDKEQNSLAAELTGVKLTTFVGASAVREAERILHEHQTTVLSERDRRMLLEALENPPPPARAARDAVRGYRTRIVIEPFDPTRHERSGFSCGTERLDNFPRLSARKRQKDNFTPLFVALAEGSPKILGYCALNAHAVAAGELGAGRLRRVPNTGGIPALHLSMMAVVQSRQGKGLGSDLAIDALGRALKVAGEVGPKLVVLDMIDNGGVEAFARRTGFYLRLGFRSFRDRPERMFITVGTIGTLFGDR